jgi:hypothetical protein
MYLCVYSVFVLSCVDSGLATGWSLVQEVLPIVYKCKIKEPHKEEAKARYGLERHIRRRRNGTTFFTINHVCIWYESVAFIELRQTAWNPTSATSNIAGVGNS